MIPVTIGDLVDATGARLYDAAGRVAVDGRTAPSTGSLTDVLIDGSVVTDSRACVRGSLYVARVGEHADGHIYVGAAAAAGAVAALTSRPVPGLPCLVVDDTQTAFGRVARTVLDRACSGLQVVGITGSSGKTSTKDALAQVLDQLGPTVAPIESYNGEIGVPLTVCRIDAATRYLIVEMGSRGLGHIDYLTRITPPQIAVVLNVGTAHVGQFGSQDAIAAAKSELVAALPADGVAVLNADDPRVSAMAENTRARVVTVGERADATLRARDIELDARGRPTCTVDTPVGTAQLTLALHGRHHVGNALAVLAVALECGMPLPEAVAHLARAGPVSRWRMEVVERPDGVTVVNDAYNANPDSMTAALRALTAMGRAGQQIGEPGAGRARRTWAVLGQMLELGPDAEAEHRRMGALAASLGIDRVLAVGAEAGPIADGALAAGMPSTRVLRADDPDTAYQVLHHATRPGDVVLFKSSRDVGLRWLGDRVAGREEGM
ncbi:MAG: UDP-N-acetylmuramoyl-tripeptide--D-alanyl-D-alanine ligase [Actinomycetales bacterium]|nr:MAG: UDP-N-acetylmuramoyl-tripeptide--D-alanyl-D-alanine ligase [Actinomycetales bacterium]